MGTMFRATILVLVPLSTIGAAQAPAQLPVGGPRFETVAIKRNPSQLADPTGSYERPDGGFAAINQPIMALVVRSYPPASQIRMQGSPDWAHFDHYDVVATSALGRLATSEERLGMIQALLRDHFKLIARFEQPEPGGSAVIVISQLEPPSQR